MAICDWFARRRADENAAVGTRAQEALHASSNEEREVIRGDIEGLAADSRAEAPFSEPEENEPRR